VLNLEECLNNEFLRPRENRCKWFNGLGVLRKCLYIEKGGKWKNLAKNNIVNRFTKCVNRFRQLNNNQDGLWRLIHIIHLLNRFICSRVKIDTIQILMNRFNQSQRVFMIWFNIIWIDSDVEKENLMLSKFDSIQMTQFKNIWLDSNT